MIGWERVDELREDIGEEDFEEVVTIFLEEVEQVIEKLRTKPDPETLGADLHFLKGSALNLGFSVFSGMCQTGETSASEGKADTVDIPSILNCYETSKIAFQDGLKTG